MSGPGPTIPAVRVSDHAVLRYLQRARGVDVEALRQEIVGLIGTSAFLGTAAVPRGGVLFVVEDYVVKTVLPRGAHFKWPKPGYGPGRKGRRR